VSRRTRLVLAEEGRGTGSAGPQKAIVLADRVTHARGPWQRARGLIGQRALAPGDALVLEPANQLHTLGMSYAVDVVFCDARGTILHVVRGLRPWRVTRWVRGARRAIELACGSVPSDIVPGMVLVEDVSPNDREAGDL
jgi:uncharacterized protein